ncbi:serine/threonine protein kinase [Minicystis rosea]|nr:serine/threonine protein kinase [Minicystis rosea]
MSEGAEQAQAGLPGEGDILAGKYRIDRILGQGGMGVVVAAHHTTLRQKVAVKFLLPEAAKRGDATERFLREARAAVSIQSEHVARVTDVGTLDTGAPYMVMEFLTGSDLSQVLEQRGPLPVEEAVDFVLQACEAIAEAHALGLVHRDLKPANLFLTSRADGSPLVKVLDFGLSKATKPDAMDASLTAAHVLMGSPYYMAPEQIRSFKTIDARADIWAIGVILFQLLTGACPFQAESLGALFMAIGSDPVPSMREIRADIPEGLEAAIVKCLEKDVKLRTQTVSALARALAPFGAENSHISVERISRVLADETPFVRTPSRASVAPAGEAPVKPAAVPGTEATIAAPSTNAITTPSAEGPKAGSMAALAVSGEGTRVSSAPPGKGGRGVLIGIGAVAAIAIAAVAARGLGGSSAPATTAVAVTAAPIATVAPTVVATAAPTVAPTASVAPAPEPSVVPSGTAAVASASAASAPSSAARTVGKAPAPKGSAGPKLSKPVSAALKHDEKFE